MGRFSKGRLDTYDSAGGGCVIMFAQIGGWLLVLALAVWVLV